MRLKNIFIQQINAKMAVSKSHCYLLSIIVLFLLNFATVTYAQIDKKTYHKEQKELERGIILRKSDGKLVKRIPGSDDFYFQFPNINVIPYYRNESALKLIKQLQESGEEDKLMEQLEKYIVNFGIKNFSEDTDLLWKLAQLYEKFELDLKAKAAYRLVLKHHKTDVAEQIMQYFKIKEHYDDLTALERDYYVPLDYYYELVEYRKAVDTLHPPKSVLLNMGDLVNKKNTPDYGPSINTRDNFMIFTRREANHDQVSRKVRYNENLYYTKNYDGFWDEAVPFPAPIQSRCNEGSACLTRDGKTIYFSRCRIEDNILDCSDCMGSCDIYMSEMDIDGKWGKPVNLGPTVNSVAWDSHPSLSMTEDTLFFASSRPGGFGLSDIYFTFRIKGGKWAKAQNLGPVINTRNNEYSPFVNWKHNVFYFSSNGHVLNFGDLGNKQKGRTIDIYKAYKVGHVWLEPINVGPLVNGPGNEFYFTIDSKAEKLYYAKTEEDATDELTTDLYSFPVPMGAQPHATVRLQGTVKDKETGIPYEGIVSIIDLDTGIEVAPKNVRSDGSYEFNLIDHKNYLLVIQGDDFFRIEKLFYLDGDMNIDSQAESVKNKKLTFSSLEFENGKANILPEMEKDLWNVVNFLVDNPISELVISGHTDSDGNANFNLTLSQKRADAIKAFIVDKGQVDPDRITAKGYGSSKPIRHPEITDEDKRINRRVEFEIIRRPASSIFDDGGDNKNKEADTDDWD